jgi:hypothetical protein
MPVTNWRVSSLQSRSCAYLFWTSTFGSPVIQFGSDRWFALSAFSAKKGTLLNGCAYASFNETNPALHALFTARLFANHFLVNSRSQSQNGLSTSTE